MNVEGKMNNPKFRKLALASMVLLLLLQPGCDSIASHTSLPPTASATITLTPTLRFTSTPRPTSTPLLTATTDAQTLLGEAGIACEQAFVSDITGGEIIAPVFSMLRMDYEDSGWTFHPLEHVTTRSAGEVRSLVCILESREKDGTYSDETLGYQRTWKVRVVAWPGGNVLSEQTWKGERSPLVKWGSGDRYGLPPTHQLISWLYDQAKISSIIVPIEDIEQIAPISDWKQLAVLTEDDYGHDRCDIWDITSRTVQSKHEFGKGYDEYDWVREMTVSPTRPEIAFSTKDGAISIWDLPTDSIEIIKDPADELYIYYHLVYSPDGKILAGWRYDSSATDYSISLWDTATHQPLHTLVGHSSTVNSLVFSPDGKSIASSSSDNTVIIWEIATGFLEQTIPDYGRVLAFSTDGANLILNGSYSIAIWDIASGQVLRSFDFYANISVYSPQAELLAGGHEVVELWNTITAKKTRTLELHTGEITAIAFSPDGTRLASGDENGKILLWDTESNQLPIELYGHVSGVIFLQFSPDGKTLLSWGDGTIRFWEIEGK
jgi:WD40 repeat protein